MLAKKNHPTLINLKIRGFTIVELLVVIVVIGVLASLTVVAFNGVQQRAIVGVLRSDLRNAGTSLEAAKIQNPGEEYPANADQLRASAGVSFQYTGTGLAYCLSATSTNVAIPAYFISSDTRSVQQGLCPGHTPPGGPLPGPFTGIATSTSHTCGVASGQAYCWGSASSGKLGNGVTTGTFATPQPVDTSVMSGTVTAIAASNFHTCAVDNAVAYCWGFGMNGRIGNGLATGGSTPIAVTTSVMSGPVTTITVSWGHTCAVASGQAHCWGSGTNRQLGNGGTSDQLSPVAVSTSVMTGTVTAIAAGNTHSCAVAAGVAYCWGSNGNGVLGIAPLTGNQSTPVAVNSSVMTGTVTAVTASSHSCAIAGGLTYCWGTGTSGQIGEGVLLNRSSPVAANTSTMAGTVSNIGSADISQHTCAIIQGRAYCWGRGDNGQIGNGLSVSQTTPALVTNP